MKTVQIRIAPKGHLMTSHMLFDMGYLDANTHRRMVWFYESGIGIENKSFQREWRKVMDAVYVAREALDAKN